MKLILVSIGLVRFWCFINISVKSWQSLLLVEETEVPAENKLPTTSHRQNLSHYVVSSTPRLSGVRTHNVSDDSIGTDCTGSSKSKYKCTI